MGKKGGRSKKPSRNPKLNHTDLDFSEDDPMDVRMDAFHKQRDMIPLDIDADDDEELDDDEEHPVFDIEVSDSDTGNEDSDADGNDGDDNEAGKLPLVAKIARQAKYLRQQMGRMEEGVEEEDDQDYEKKPIWGRHKNMYFGADNANFELQSSDDELLAEEHEALRLQREKSKSLLMEDFGLEDSEREEELDHSKKDGSFEAVFASRPSVKDDSDKTLDAFQNLIEIRKDVDALSKSQKMDIVYSSAPELVGLLSELNETLEQCKSTKSLLFKVKDSQNCKEGSVVYLEMKQRLMLAYCQAIGFYLLLKSEGHSICDHPVISRLVELRNLVEKVKCIDMNIPSEDEISKSLNNDLKTEEQKSKDGKDGASKDKLSNIDAQVVEISTSGNVVIPKDSSLENAKITEQIGLQSKKMLELRANLEEKLKQKGIYNSLKQSSGNSCNRATRAVNKHMEALMDFDDEVIGHPVNNPKGIGQISQPSKRSQVASAKGILFSGDDDLPRRDDIGERRRKLELRVLARAGAGSMDDVNGTLDDETECQNLKKMDNGLVDDLKGGSEDEFYREAKQQRVSKLSSRAEKYSKASLEPISLLESQEETDGKRSITRQIEKNRGLTRHRKKEIKNPRKKYKIKHKKAMVRRKGQVRDIRKPSGPYGGEATGINIGVSRSVRFKN